MKLTQITILFINLFIVLYLCSIIYPLILTYSIEDQAMIIICSFISFVSSIVWILVSFNNKMWNKDVRGKLIELDKQIKTWRDHADEAAMAFLATKHGRKRTEQLLDKYLPKTKDIRDNS